MKEFPDAATSPLHPIKMAVIRASLNGTQIAFYILAKSGALVPLIKLLADWSQHRLETPITTSKLWRTSCPYDLALLGIIVVGDIHLSEFSVNDVEPGDGIVVRCAWHDLNLKSVPCADLVHHLAQLLTEDASATVWLTIGEYEQKDGLLASALRRHCAQALGQGCGPSGRVAEGVHEACVSGTLDALNLGSVEEEDVNTGGIEASAHLDD
mmetsp:Transcript_110243/g.246376  ORF Transcript_110243/g.246376 Transcript_110243/m.246376 type:complete len:211 (+) Transcript_110243:133-765(+)